MLIHNREVTFTDAPPPFLQGLFNTVNDFVHTDLILVLHKECAN